MFQGFIFLFSVMNNKNKIETMTRKRQKVFIIFILEASKLFKTSQNIFLKKSAYCFSLTSSVDLNSLRNFSNINQKNFKILVLIILKI